MDNNAISTGLTGKEVKEFVSSMTSSQNACGFEVYVITKKSPKLKKMQFLETEKNNLRLKIKNSIFKYLSENFVLEESEYAPVERIADEQNKMYIIPPVEQFDSFSVLKTDAGTFMKSDMSDATGVAFLISKNDRHFWAYQHIWSMMIPNKKKKGLIVKIISSNKGDIFEEMNDPLLTIGEKVNLIILDDHIITSDIKLLQNSFGFHEYIIKCAEKTIARIETKGIVKNPELLKKYILRGKPKYSKKMLRIADSKVLKMDTEKLMENIHKSPRWNGKIKEEQGQFVLDTYVQVENLIDLLDERYTFSEITGTEYDTDAKRVAD